MTTLNTIIEEEKKGAKESVLETFDDGTIRYCPRDLETKITTAMQRAYEAGKADSAHENTPDIEWEKGWKFKLQEMVAEYQHGRLALSCDVLEFVESLLTSRDTYWKERVRKEVEGMKKEEPKHAGYSRVDASMYSFARGFNQALDTLLDNLK